MAMKDTDDSKKVPKKSPSQKKTFTARSGDACLFRCANNTKMQYLQIPCLENQVWD